MSYIDEKLQEEEVEKDVEESSVVEEESQVVVEEESTIKEDEELPVMEEKEEEKEADAPTPEESGSLDDSESANDLILKELVEIKDLLDVDKVLNDKEIQNLAVKMGRLVIRIHDSTDVKYMQFYLEYLLLGNKYGISIERALLTVIKPSARKHSSVSMFNTALHKIARCIRAGNEVSLNIDPLRKTIINPVALNFIVSKTS